MCLFLLINVSEETYRKYAIISVSEETLNFKRFLVNTKFWINYFNLTKEACEQIINAIFESEVNYER